jgi:inosine-uridine nucleoside N-ribohydrolase
MRKVLIDTDPGVDDAVALALAFCLSSLEVVGLTSVGGNASIEDTTRNLAALLKAMGQEQVPFARGAARQLGGASFKHAYHIHGDGSLGVPLPAPLLAPIDLPASDFILNAAGEHQGALTIIALGPLTNLAIALRRDEDVLEGLAEIVVMGGAFAGAWKR